MSNKKNDNYINDNNGNDRKNLAQKGIKSDFNVPAILRKDVFYELSLKAEKVNSAMYLVTGLMPRGEQLVTELRGQGLQLVKQLYFCLGRDEFDRREIGGETLSVIQTIISLLSTAYVAGFISEMNVSILKRELMKLSTAIDKELPNVHEPAGSFKGTLEEIEKDELEKMFGTDSEDTKNLSDAVSVEDEISDSELDPSSYPDNQSDLSDKISDNKTTNQNVGYVKRQTTHKTTYKKKSSGKERREFIISLLNHHGQATMKDIATRITNCTEKTLQRDLARLISDGYIEKEGDKRWSLYKKKNS